MYEAGESMSFVTRILRRLNPNSRTASFDGIASLREVKSGLGSSQDNQEQFTDTNQVEGKVDTSNLRQIIVNYHIFKNGGSSVDEILNYNFGSRFAYLEGDTPSSALRPSVLHEFLKDNENLVAVSSGFLRPSLAQEVDIIPIIFLRDPLDRAYSVYSFERRVEIPVPSNKIARQHNFVEYVDWCLNNQEKGGMVITNYQVTHLSPASFKYDHVYKAKPTEADFNVSLRYLSSIPFVGIVDEFEASMKRISEVCAKRGVTLRVFPAHTNSSPERTGSLAQRRLELINTLSDSLLRHFNAANLLDEQLYQHFRRKFDQVSK
jgi:hypothetical protein